MTLRDLGAAGMVAILIGFGSVALAQQAGPAIEHSAVAQAVQGQPLTINATIRSPAGVFQPVVMFRHPGEATWRKQELLAGEHDSFVATLPGSAVSADLEYYIEAYDNDGNGPARSGSPDTPYHVSLTAAAPSAPAAAVSAPSNAQSSSGGWKPIAGWSGVGVGGAALAAGAVLLVVASNEESAAQSDPTAAGAFAKSQTASSENTAGIATLVVGGVLAVAGAVILLIPSSHSAAAAEQP